MEISWDRAFRTRPDLSLDWIVREASFCVESTVQVFGSRLIQDGFSSPSAQTSPIETSPRMVVWPSAERHSISPRPKSRSPFDRSRSRSAKSPSWLVLTVM